MNKVSGGSQTGQGDTTATLAFIDIDPPPSLDRTRCLCLPGVRISSLARVSANFDPGAARNRGERWAEKRYRASRKSDGKVLSRKVSPTTDINANARPNLRIYVFFFFYSKKIFNIFETRVNVYSDFERRFIIHKTNNLNNQILNGELVFNRSNQ